MNASGIFNVPYGQPRSEFVANPDNLKSCAAVLGSSGISLRACDFEQSVATAKEGDLVYLDPPYVTGHTDNGFIEYNEVLFSWEDQGRLARVAKRLAGNGVHVIVSNANHERVIDLYRGFSIKHFDRKSTLASDITRRRSVSEVLLFSIG